MPRIQWKALVAPFTDDRFLRAFLSLYFLILVLSWANFFSSDASSYLSFFVASLGTNFFKAIRSESELATTLLWLREPPYNYCFVLFSMVAALLSIFGRSPGKSSFLIFIATLILGHALGFRMFYIEFYCYAILAFCLGSMLERSLLRSRHIPTDCLATIFSLSALGAALTTSAITKILTSGFHWFSPNNMIFVLTYHEKRRALGEGDFDVPQFIDVFFREHPFSGAVASGFFACAILLEGVAVFSPLFRRNALWFGCLIASMFLGFYFFVGLRVTSVGFLYLVVAYGFYRMYPLINRSCPGMLKLGISFGIILVLAAFILPGGRPSQQHTVVFPIAKFSMFSTLRQQIYSFKSASGRLLKSEEIFPKIYISSYGMASLRTIDRICPYINGLWRQQNRKPALQSVDAWRYDVWVSKPDEAIREKDTFLGRCVLDPLK